MTAPTPTRRQRRTTVAPRRRRAIAVLVVLALVSVALAMSFALLRSQTTGIQLQANGNRNAQARQAALTGMSTALREMRLASWSGVGSSLARSINATDSYNVTFTAGDPTLAPGDASYAEYPYRVTVLSTGTSIDPAQPAVASTYKVRSVLKLVPRELTASPSNWSTMLSYVVYQLTNKSIYMAVPCHIEGPVRLQGGINVASTYSWNTTPRNRYLSDLQLMRSAADEVQTITRFGGLSGTFKVSFNGATSASILYNASAAMLANALRNMSTIGNGNVNVTGSSGAWTVTFTGALAGTNVPQMTVDASGVFAGTMSVSTSSHGNPGAPDCRPFSGPISAPTSQTTSENLGLLTSQLGLTVNNISSSSQSAPTLGSVTTYRLYPGGPQYNVATLPSSVSNATLTSDPVANPLGLFYCSGNSTLGNNVTIAGTVITGADLTINGTNVQITPFDLVSLEGSTTPIRLPTVITLDDFRVGSGAQGTITGVVYAADEFSIEEGDESTSLSITGNVIAGAEISFNRRTQWKNYSGTLWDTHYTTFQTQINTPVGIAFFPMWLSTLGRSYVPKLTIQADAQPSVTCWQTLSNPVYAVKSGDSGLHWDLASWTENP